MTPLGSSFWKLLGVAAFSLTLSFSAALASETVTSPGGNVFKVIQDEPAAEEEQAAPETPAADEAAPESDPVDVVEPGPTPEETEPLNEPETATPSATEPTTSGVVSETEEITPAAGDGRIQLTAVIARGAPPMNDNISYTIERVEYGAPKEVVATKTGPTADISLPNGRYRVRAAYREVVTEEEVVVNGETSHEVNLNAGFIILRMIPFVGGDPISSPIDWEVRTFAKNYKGERDLLQAVSGVPTTTVVLPEGWYMVHAYESGELTKHAIEVTPGATVKYTLVRQ